MPLQRQEPTLIAFICGPSRDDSNFLPIQCRYDNQDSSGICFTDVGNSLLAIAEFGLEIHWPIEDDLLGFFRLNSVFGNVGNVRVIPLEIQIAHGRSSLQDQGT